MPRQPCRRDICSHQTPTAGLSDAIPDGSTSRGRKWALSASWAHPAWFLGLTYAAGYVTVNRYLASYAEVSGELVQSRYLSAGALFLLVVGVPVASAFAEWQVVKQWANQEGRAGTTASSHRSWLKRVAIAGLLLLLVQAAFVVLWDQQFVQALEVSHQWGSSATEFGLVSFSAFVLAYLVDANRPMWWSTTHTVAWKFHNVATPFALGVGSLLFFLSTFANEWYPRIRPEYGGGAAPVAAVYVRDTGLASKLGLDTLDVVAMVGQYQGFVHIVSCVGPRRRLQSVAIALQDISAIRYLQSTASQGNAVVVLSDGPCRQLEMLGMRHNTQR